MNLRAKTLIAEWMRGSGVLRAAGAYFRTRGSAVFAFHRVLPRAEMSECYNPHLAITPESFDAFLIEIRRQYVVIPLLELVKRLRDRQSLKGTCVLTFDDGWEDNYRIAFPILLKHQVPATIFLVTGMMDTSLLMPEERLWRLWTRVLELAPTHLGALRCELQALTLSSGKDLEALHPEFKKVRFDSKVAFLDRMEASYGFERPAQSRYLTWAQVLEMYRQGISFGSHTVRHAILPAEDLPVIRQELNDSKQALEARLGCPVDLFAYPSGRYHQTVAKAAQEAGYSCAVTTVPGATTISSHPFEIPRITIDNTVVNDQEWNFSAARTQFHIVRSLTSSEAETAYQVAARPS